MLIDIGGQDRIPLVIFLRVSTSKNCGIILDNEHFFCILFELILGQTD